MGISTHQPFKSEVLKPKDYHFQKGGFAIIVLAGCDVDARFICASCDHSDSTNDIIAWGDTKLLMKLHNLCIDCNVETPLHRFHEDIREGDS